jgi:hypothetical protein
VDLRRSTVDPDLPVSTQWLRALVSANEIGRPKGRPKRAVRARGMLMEVPAAAAEVAAAKAAHVFGARRSTGAGLSPSTRPTFRFGSGPSRSRQASTWALLALCFERL